MSESAPEATGKITSGGAKGDPDYSISIVPPDARMRRGSMHMAYWAPVSALFPVVFASVLSAQYGAMNTLVGTAAAMIIIGLLAGFMARFAIRTGMSTDLFSRAVFGRSGGLLATMLLFATTAFYAVVESSIIAEALTQYFPGLHRWLAYALVVALCLPVVFGGIAEYLDKFNGYLLPFFVVGMIIIIWAAISKSGYDNSWLSFGPDGGAIDAGALKIFVLWTLLGIQIMATLDYARFGDPSDEDYHARITFGIPLYFTTFSINGAIGIFLTASVASGDTSFASESSAVKAILELTGFIGLLFIIVSQMRINSLNYQLSTVNFQAFLKHLNLDITKILSALMIGVAVFLVMLGDILSVLLGAVTYSAIFLGAWAAMAIIHVAMMGHQSISAELAAMERRTDTSFWHASTTIWLVAATSGIIANNWIGSISEYSSAVSAAAASLLYFLYLKLFSVRPL